MLGWVGIGIYVGLGWLGWGGLPPQTPLGTGGLHLPDPSASSRPALLNLFITCMAEGLRPLDPLWLGGSAPQTPPWLPPPSAAGYDPRSL